MENEFWLFISMFIYSLSSSCLVVVGAVWAKGVRIVEMVEMVGASNTNTLRLDGRYRAGAGEVSFVWLAVDAQTTHRAFASGTRFDPNDSKLLIMHALWQPALRWSGRLHSLIRLPKAFPPQMNSCSAMYYCQIISLSTVFYPLLPSIIAFSRRNL